MRGCLHTSSRQGCWIGRWSRTLPKRKCSMRMPPITMWYSWALTKTVSPVTPISEAPSPNPKPTKEMWRAVILSSDSTTQEPATPSMCLKRLLICCPSLRYIKRTGRGTVMWRSAVWQNTLLLQQLADNPHIQKAGLCLDHDEAGINAVKRVTKMLSERG